MQVQTFSLETLDELLAAQIQDLYDAENRLLTALAQFQMAASNLDLKKAFAEHLAETRNHITRLEEAAGETGLILEGETCEAMEGLLAEAAEIIQAPGNPGVKDAALIAAAQRVEHYEMAGYGSARAFAKQLGYKRVADLFTDTLDEEGAANKKLTTLAEGRFFSSGINQKAQIDPMSRS